MLLVITVSVALVASVATIVNSIDLTVLTMYGYQRHLCIVTPRNALELADDLVILMRDAPQKPKIVPVRAAFTVVKTIFGKMPMAVSGIDPENRNEIMQKCGLKLNEGRWPINGMPEVVLHKDIAKNRHLRLGDPVLTPDSEDSYAAVPAKLVGTVDGPVWYAMTTREFVAEKFPVSQMGYIAIARTEAAQRLLDNYLDAKLDKSRCRLWSYKGLVRETREALSSLYLILGIVVGTIIFAISFLTGMLSNIYFMQRMPEFATLSAIGYQRKFLLRRALAETTSLCVVGWIFGAALTSALLTLLKMEVLSPRGLLLNPFDLSPYLLTIPLPFTIAIFALIPISRKLKKMDPVTIIERRQ